MKKPKAVNKERMIEAWFNQVVSEYSNANYTMEKAAKFLTDCEFDWELADFTYLAEIGEEETAIKHYFPRLLDRYPAIIDTKGAKAMYPHLADLLTCSEGF
jgi:hypothetical protein